MKKEKINKLKQQLEEQAKAINIKEQNLIKYNLNKKIEKEIEKYNKSLKFNDDKRINEYYKPLIRAVIKLIRGYTNIVFIKGKSGIGKTYQIERLLNKYKVDYIEYGGSNVSEAYLYRILYENRFKGNIIYFKDVAMLLKELKSIDLLKMATETKEKRLITKANYSKKQDDLPDRFLYEGSLIFDFNSLVGLKFKEDFEALITRGEFIELTFSFDEIKEIMLLICKNKQEREITKYLIDKYDYLNNEFNLRTQYRAFQTYQYSKKYGLEWEKEIDDEIKQNMTPVRRLLYQFIGKNYVEEREVIKFLIRNGYFNTIRTAERRIEDWIYLGEVYTNGMKRNRSIGLFPLDMYSDINVNKDRNVRR